MLKPALTIRGESPSQTNTASLRPEWHLASCIQIMWHDKVWMTCFSLQQWHWIQHAHQTLAELSLDQPNMMVENCSLRWTLCPGLTSYLGQASQHAPITMPTNALDAVLGTNSSAIYRQMTTASRLLHHVRYQSSSPNSRTARSMSQTLAEGPPAEASTCTCVLRTCNSQFGACRAVCVLVRCIMLTLLAVGWKSIDSTLTCTIHNCKREIVILTDSRAAGGAFELEMIAFHPQRAPLEVATLWQYHLQLQ